MPGRTLQSSSSVCLTPLRYHQVSSIENYVTVTLRLATQCDSQAEITPCGSPFRNGVHVRSCGSCEDFLCRAPRQRIQRNQVVNECMQAALAYYISHLSRFFDSSTCRKRLSPRACPLFTACRLPRKSKRSCSLRCQEMS